MQRDRLTHGFDDRGWTLKRVMLLIGRLFHNGYTIHGVWRLLRRHGWSRQVPVRRAREPLMHRAWFAVRRPQCWLDDVSRVVVDPVHSDDMFPYVVPGALGKPGVG
ncbi:winged helix-turn-helix domain-containing protein [Streptomyces sp. JH34]|uniref:helix-turn-helix domain-containing protein n=1 Tax=Streptomyces sp. JH34 TaxID=2793633 RepID=UPI0023F7747E|nr:winged helix-turn-helix domain-containing protein [Streptomyces sp. JH34]